jgi:hypothetical protein
VFPKLGTLAVSVPEIYIREFSDMDFGNTVGGGVELGAAGTLRSKWGQKKAQERVVFSATLLGGDAGVALVESPPRSSPR